MADLQEATGIDKKQLARDFGSKIDLFLTVLSDYWQLLREVILAPLEAEGAGLRDLRKAIRTVAERANYPEAEIGCLVCTTALDTIAMEDPRVTAAIRTCFERLEHAYYTGLKSAQKRGEIELTPRGLRRSARALVGAHIAMTVLLRSGAPDKVVGDIAEHALSTLG